MTFSIHLPEGSRFSCRSCGRCCTGWAVPVDQATIDRLRARDWAGEPFERTPSSRQPWRVRMIDGRCFFLDRENRCRIHNEISYEAKPAACRAFPLAVLEVAGERYGRLSYWCPTVTANQGQEVARQSRWLQETVRLADRRTAPLKINEKTGIGLRELRQVHLALRLILTEAELPMSERLAAAAAIVRRLDQRAQKGDAPAIDSLLAAAECEGAVTLAAETRQNESASSSGPLFLIYLGQDCRKGRIFRIGRFLSLLLFNLGLGRLHSRAMGAGASRRQLGRVAFEPTTAARDLLTCYFCSKLDSRRYLAGEATLVEGFNLLVAAYAIVNLLARTRAAAARRSRCDDHDVRMAVEAADLLVVEHPSLYQGKYLANLTGTALGSADLCGAVLARLEKG